MSHSSTIEPGRSIHSPSSSERIDRDPRIGSKRSDPAQAFEVGRCPETLGDGDKQSPDPTGGRELDEALGIRRVPYP
ncbi:MAG: hypothetical protein WKF58_20360 [Ilumatobacteraceae bacterium]